MKYIKGLGYKYKKKTYLNIYRCRMGIRFEKIMLAYHIS